MRRASFSIAARSLRAVSVLGSSLLLTASAYATTATTLPEASPAAPPAVTPAVPAPAASAIVQSHTAPSAAPRNASKPLWTELTPTQQQALAPLASEWDELDTFRKNKWLAIGNKFASMKPEEQQRMQERMRDWVKLTPEQRRIARESYSRAKKLNADQKSAQWEQYQQLPEDQKKKLAADAAAKKPVATLPRATSQGTANNTIPPIKSAPKPVLEQSVTPKAATQSALQPSAPPTK